MKKIQPIPADSDSRLCVRVYSNSGELVERSYGPSTTELQEAHNNHTCGAFCGICYHEAMVSIGLE